MPCGSYVPTYAIRGELTEFKWHLTEYDALIETCYRRYVGHVYVSGSLKPYMDNLYDSYLYLQTISYPKEVEEIHNLYLACLLRPQSLWEVYDPGRPDIITGTEIPPRIISIYNDYSCQRERAEADYRLFELMEQEGIYPLIR